ncbi:tRNA threonylcarbamoyladenosine biosynthesis protein TsaB [Fontibacillus phaseoli]|uniref:tRNA threonylcarbamoyladenosine biosynthesis protein TsaB n=1 Tax=Fontibacillus phaseoli TaxID=1416533 RepID=A0A369BIW3_9BACL|nr:tRNA (adenosine(37)-N6)-threonylcarbamoyltransferase complex dimerization subunit type 1 TsaB [Fontibacillus phaseoli]RCX20518.1 tRNA threonylcarbamoyladenosine biosynthesis protein TsaB [Fontibacillus phaseoli]
MNHLKHEKRPLQRLLAFDTSTSSLAVAVMENGKLLAETNIHAERNHSAYLVSAIGDVLAAAGIAKAELDGIAVGMGPGSYTGARIAVTTAKTLAWSLRLPVFGVSSLEAIALGGWARSAGQDAAELGRALSDLAEAAKSDPATGDRSGTDGAAAEANRPAGHWIIPLVDARRGQAYTALFAAEAGRMPERLEPDGIRLMASWTEQLAGLLNSLAPEDRPSGVWFVGETAQHEPPVEALRPILGEALHLIPYELEGIWIGLAGARRALLRGGDDVHALEPNYTQLAEAEAKRLRER